MATRMLIDARHPEETRVAVLKGNRIDEFDFESADRKQIKGNIYLAKVTRVEPSLQAAFVDFGGNRHGFLAFSEIHPDYYQIPKDDRDALLAEEAAHAEEEAALRAQDNSDDDGDSNGSDGYDDDDDENEEDLDGGLTEVDTSDADRVSTIEAGHVENGNDDDAANGDDESDDGDESAEANDGDNRSGRSRRRGRRQGGGRGRSKEADDLRARRMALRRRYKIQDVIHRRQVLLVQVVKEERGNKGAALTTYLSLAGRYCVLMPNSSHGGGISRKINSASDRKRLKSIVNELSLPKTMGCIVRTAGLSRTKTEIKRDFDYLARLWDELRERTLGSSAPALIHSDSDLIKRAIRDIYNRDIEEVIVEGEDGYRAAREFMKLLMPSHARRVKSYNDAVPLFQRYGAEDQLTAMYDPVVQLKSGGYIVINPTEALVSIDINSGRATKEHGIEGTAVSTNVEAAHEIARQLRLRDMAGLVVIDFIDMEYGSNVRKVEKAMKDSLKNDRARIQVGRISSFGLMEMSRQRLRTGVLEATTRECPHCDGTGLVRTASSAGLSALRLIEDEAAKGKGSTVTLYASSEAAIYLLNSKRADLADIETRYGVSVEVIPEGENEGAKMRVLSSGPRPQNAPVFEPIVDDDEDDAALEDESAFDEDDDAENEADGDDDGSRRKRRRRRGRGRGRDREQSVGDSEEGESETSGEDSSASDDSDEDDDAPRKRRRRGGRRRRGRGRSQDGDSVQDNDENVDSVEADGDDASDAGDDAADLASRQEDVDQADDQAETEDAKVPEDDVAEEPVTPKPRARRRKKPAAEEDAAPAEAASAETAPADESDAEKSEPPKRKRAPRKKAAEKSGDADVEASEEPKKPGRARRKKAEPKETAPADTASEDAPAKPRRTRRKKVAEPEVAEGASTDESSADSGPEPAVQREAAPQAAVQEAQAASETSEKPRRGWWQRTFGE